jgi:hypothetical protein
MNAKQSNKFASYIAVETVLKAIPEIDTFPGLPAEVAELSAMMGEINRLAETQNSAVVGKRLVRDELLAAMAEATVEVATAVAAYADKQKLTELGQLVRVTPVSFTRLRKTERPVLANGILRAAQASLPELAAYGVTAETLTDLQARIAAAQEGLGQPRSGILDRKIATQQIASLFDEVDALLEGQIDRLMFPVRKVHPELYDKYVAARQIIDLPGVKTTTPAPTGAGVAATVASTEEKAAA